MFVPLAPAAQNLGVGLRRPCRGQVFGGILGAMALIAPPQPNEAMARIAPRLVPVEAQRHTILLVPSHLYEYFFSNVDSGL